MELWELLQLPRPDIDKMREEVDEAVAPPKNTSGLRKAKIVL